MDIEERALEAEQSLPLRLTPIRDTDQLEGLNTLVTLATPQGRVELVLSGRVADPDRYFEAVSRSRPSVLDVDLTDRAPTTDMTPHQFLSGQPVLN